MNAEDIVCLSIQCTCYYIYTWMKSQVDPCKEVQKNCKLSGVEMSGEETTTNKTKT